MNLFERIKNWLRAVLKLDDPLKGELRNVHAVIAHLKPPYYRFKNNLILPGFASDLFLFCSALKPLMMVADRTVAHPDVRVSRRFFDLLIDARLPAEEVETKTRFTYEAMKSRIENAIKAEDEFDNLNREFQAFIKRIDGLAAANVNAELHEVQRFTDLCKHDWERTLGFFDPGVSLDDPRYVCDPQPTDADQVHNEIVDVWFLLDGFSFSDSLYRNFMIAFERNSADAAKTQAQKTGKIFAALEKIIRFRLSPANLLALARLAKRQPAFIPNLQHERKDYLDDYRRRLVSSFEKDRERLRRERHETAVANDIQELFGGVEPMPVEEYDETNDAYLRRETPAGFTHIKPLGILKTFTYGIFERSLRESIKKILVEGYFDNKIYQNNLANLVYQCERTGTRIAAFERNLRENARISMGAVRRYVDEMRHGKDILVFLNRIVDEINFNARQICEDETGLFQMLSDSVGELLADYKKSSPDLVTNIRTLGGVHNREIMGGIADSKRRIDTFIRVMKNFTIIKSVGKPPAGAPPSEEPAAKSPVEELLDAASELEDIPEA